MKKMTSPQTKRKNENSDEEEKKEADRKEKDPPMTELQSFFNFFLMISFDY